MRGATNKWGTKQEPTQTVSFPHLMASEKKGKKEGGGNQRLVNRVIRRRRNLWKVGGGTQKTEFPQSS